jgi:hypothetical protein
VIPWTGDLPFLGRQEIALPPLKFTVLPTRNEFMVYLSNPNQRSDRYTDNDFSSCLFDAAPRSGIPLQVEIRTDQYPGETSWNIINASGQVIFHGGPYLNPLTTYQENLTFSLSDCYTFQLYDSGNDGMDGRYGQGHFILRNQDGQIMAQGGKFGSQAELPFEIDVRLEVPDISLISDFTVFPNPFDNTATLSLFLARPMSVKIRVTNEMGQTLFTQDSDDLPPGTHTFELNGDSWAPGIYIVKVLAGDQVITKKLTLSK